MNKLGFEIKGSEEQLKKAQDMLLKLALEHEVLIQIMYEIELDLKAPFIQPYDLDSSEPLNEECKKFIDKYMTITNEHEFDGRGIEVI